jgi:hypothetical protein
MADELGQIEGGWFLLPSAPEVDGVIEHALVPPRILLDHLL